MSDAQATPTPADVAPANDFTPITSQADLDKIIGARVAREREKFSDYNDLKAKAAQVDAAAEAGKTEAEKLAARIKALEDERTALAAKAARATIKSELAGFGDAADALVGNLDLSRFVNEAGDIKADALADFKASLATLAPSRNTPRPDDSQASGGQVGLGGTPLSPGEQFANLIRSQLG